MRSRVLPVHLGATNQVFRLVMYHQKKSSFVLPIKDIQAVSPNLLSHLQSFLNTTANQSLHSATTILVGLSGGIDSSVLLQLLNVLIEQHHSNSKHRFCIQAMHVDHGLSPNARDWAEHCRLFCKKLDVNLITRSVVVNKTQRKGLEAAAREQRYAVIKEYIQELETEAKHVILVTGHHLRDQAETVLHNLSRGAGVNGLAAMPLCKNLIFDHEAPLDTQHCRPMLKVHYQEIVDYANACGLQCIHDESNDDKSFKRNSIRHEVLPYLENYWPNIQASLAKTSEYMQEASLLLDDLAKSQLANHSYSFDFIELNIADDAAKQKNFIRYWLKIVQPSIVLSAKHYEWIVNALTQAQNSKNSDYCYFLSGFEIRVYKSRVYFLDEKPKLFQFEFDSMGKLQSFIDDKKNNEFKKLDALNAEFGFESGHLLGRSYSFKINALEPVFNVRLMSYQSLPSSFKRLLSKRKIKTFFQTQSIPPWERAAWPVLIVNDELNSSKCQIFCLTMLYFYLYRYYFTNRRI